MCCCVGVLGLELVYGSGLSGFCHGGMVRCSTGVFFLKVGLYNVDDLKWVCGYDVGDWVSYGFKFGLVFGIGL